MVALAGAELAVWLPLESRATTVKVYCVPPARPEADQDRLLCQFELTQPDPPETQLKRYCTELVSSMAVVAVMLISLTPGAAGAVAQDIGLGVGAVVSAVPFAIPPLMKYWPRLL